MKIGIVVDGDAESQALRSIVTKIEQQTPHHLMPPIYANMQPKASPAQIAKAAESRLGMLRTRGADRIVVLIDREDNQSCPGELAQRFELGFQQIGQADVTVVIKDRTFENWLVADPGALRLTERFRVTKGLTDNVVPDKADLAEAENLLHAHSVVRQYHKRHDAMVITAHQDLLTVAGNSRSFRRFLRVTTHPAYAAQSRNP